MVNYCNSYDNQYIREYVQILNINVDGTLCSIYNVELEDDSIGISNKKERRKQLRQLRNIIEDNKNKCKNEEMRKFTYGDNTYLACNRNIHIITGMFHINEIKNGEINFEYNEMNDILGSLDTNRWVNQLRNYDICKQRYTNIRYTKDSYILILVDNINNTENDIEKKIFENHKTVIISSNIAKNHVDMNQFNNYPEDVIFMLFRPNIDICNFRNSNNYIKKPKCYNSRSSDDTTKFIEQYKNKISVENRDDDVHSKFGKPINDIEK